MESLVQALLESPPASYTSKATQTDAPQTTTGYISKATQTDTVQPPGEYGSEATQTDIPDAPTPKECCNKVEDSPAQLPMVQQLPRGSHADHIDITWPVSRSPRESSNSVYKSYLQPVGPPKLRTLSGVSSIPERVHTGHSDKQELSALARLRQADPGFNIGNGSISVKSTIDEAIERYHSVIR